MRPIPTPRTGLAIALAIAIAGCSSVPQKRGEATPRASTGGNMGPPTASPSRKGGGYYLDDGPGDNPPPDLALLPDAVPRVEKYASGANRPYNVFGVDYVPDLSGAPYKQRGVGSWYGRKFHGQRTSSGEIYDMYAMTAAHPTLPIPCYALVTNLQNGRSVIVRVNDRGPFLHNRVMDLSYAAAFKLGYMSSGSGMIEVEMLMPADIAAGRIPATTTGLLASASAMMPVATTRPGATQAPVATTSPVTDQPRLTIEALTAGAPPADAPRPSVVASSGSMPGLPAAPTIAADAASRSLPLSTRADMDPGPDLVVQPDRQPAATLPEIASGAGFYLQLGAFKAKAGADSFATHVARELDPSVASKMKVSGGNGLYRVRVGPYSRRPDADAAAASLRAAIAQPVLVMPDGPTR